MVKAGELRIGNILQKHDGTIFTVTSKFIAEYDGHEDEMLMSNPPKPFFDGVPLNEEWLVDKFGFIQVSEVRCAFAKDDVEIWNEEGKWHKVTTEDCSEGVEIKYIHRLQNLFHELEDKELTLNK